MVVCKFWERGSCRNGNNCRFEHPPARQQGGNPFQNEPRNQGRNPFNALRDDQPRGPRHGGGGGGGGDSYRPESRRYDNDRSQNHDRSRGNQAFEGQSGGQVNSSDRNYRFNVEQIRADLSSDLPEYPFSNYAGDGTNDPPKHFFDPQMEVSPEELRVKYYLARLQGQEQQAQAEESQLHHSAMGEIAKVRQDIHGAIKMIAAAKRERPNRWDVVDQNKGSGNPNPFVRASMPFAAPTGPSQSSGFGRPSSLGVGANPFGQPPGPPQSSGFNQPSQMGQQPSGLGQPPQVSPRGGFGQPSQVGRPNVFGQPSQAGGAQNPFGQPSQASGGSNPFGQPSQQSQAAPGFGQPSNLGSRPGFGQPSASGPTPGFGQPSQLGGGGGGGGGGGDFANKPNPFVQPSSNGAAPFGQGNQPPQQANPFGQPAQPGFGQQQQGRGGVFGQLQQPMNGFGQPSGLNQPQQPPNGLGQAPGGFGQQSGGFAQPVQQINGGGFGQQHNGFNKPALDGFAAPSLQINTAQPALNGSYTTDPPSATARDADPPDELYGSKKGEFEEVYKQLLTTNAFADEIMPEIAPLHNWVGWGPMERKFAA